MDLGTVFIFTALFLLVLVYIARPFLRGGGVAVTETDRQLSTLKADKDRVLSALQELELDHAMGKLEDEDFRTQREGMVSNGAKILRNLDQLQTSAELVENDLGLEDDIEAAVTKLRESMDVSEVRYCGVCGRKIVEGDQFCVGCGSSLMDKVES